jgi:hypothetical protein
MGLKQGAIGNTHGEHIENLLEQRKNEKNLLLPPPSRPKLKRKPMGNTLGTCWNKGKMKKIFLFPPSPLKLKRKPMGNTLGTCWNKGKM